MTTNPSSSLNQLLEIARDGREFYTWAASQKTSEELNDLFRAMASAKAELINDLAAHVVALGAQPATGGTLAGTILKVYSEARAKFSAELDPVLVSQLEEAEDRLLHAFEHAASEDSAEVRDAVARYLPRVRAGHDRMRDLKQAFSR